MIYVGNTKDPEGLAEKYEEEYARFMYDQKEAILKETTTEDLAQTAAEMQESAGGLQQWAHSSYR